MTGHCLREKLGIRKIPRCQIVVQPFVIDNVHSKSKNNPDTSQRVRERGSLSLPVVAIGSIPYIILACGFPAPGDPRCLAHIREHNLTLCQLTDKGHQPDMGQVSIRPASIIAFADVFELHRA